VSLLRETDGFPRARSGAGAGGAVQGIGATLSETIVYDGAGQPLTGSLTEYAIQRHDTVPWI